MCCNTRSPLPSSHYCLMSSKCIPFMFACITSAMRLCITSVDTHYALIICRMTEWHPHLHHWPLRIENDCSRNVRATWITFGLAGFSHWCIMAAASIIYRDLRPQPWAASVPLFPLQPWNSSTRVKRSNNSIFWDKGKGQSLKKKEGISKIFFSFSFSP